MQRLQTSYAGSPRSVPEARHAVEVALRRWGLEDLVWTAALLVSELAANALLHARTDFTVTVCVLPDGAARLEVTDGSRSVPRSRRYGQEATTGRGLRLVEDLSRGWGVEAGPEGKTVWVEVEAAAPPARRPGEAGPEDTDVDALLRAFPDLQDGDLSALAA